MHPLLRLLLCLILIAHLLGCASPLGHHQPPPPPEAAAPIVWPSQCFSRPQPMPDPPAAAPLPLSAPDAKKRDVFEAVQSGFIDMLKAWGKTANENLDACAAKHRELAH